MVETTELEPKTEGDGRNTSAIDTFNPYGTAHLFLDIPLHGQYQIPHRASSASASMSTTPAYSGRSTFVLGDSGRAAGSEHEDNDSHVDVKTPYVPRPEDYQISLRSILRSRIGSSPVEPLHSLPIEATRRNAELMYMCECCRICRRMRSANRIQSLRDSLRICLQLMVRARSPDSTKNGCHS